jgi:hypothetical protein
MAIHGHGHGLYETESASHLRPGTCGYIDSTGHWQHIVNLLDRKELDKGGYTSIGYVRKAEAAEAVWKDTASEGVTSFKPAIEAGTTVSGAPVEAVARFEQQISKQFLAQARSTADSLIFATAPVGILSAVVSAIRLGGNKLLRTIIGRKVMPLKWRLLGLVLRPSSLTYMQEPGK